MLRIADIIAIIDNLKRQAQIVANAQAFLLGGSHRTPYQLYSLPRTVPPFCSQFYRGTAQMQYSAGPHSPLAKVRPHKSSLRRARNSQMRDRGERHFGSGEGKEIVANHQRNIAIPAGVNCHLAEPPRRLINKVVVHERRRA